MMENLLARITLNPNVNHGQPEIRNTRYMVGAILEYLAGGDTVEDILAECPDLEREDIRACIAYAAASMRFKDIEVILNTEVSLNGEKSNAGSSTTIVVSTQVPGVDMTQVIASPPHLVKENSAEVDVKSQGI